MEEIKSDLSGAIISDYKDQISSDRSSGWNRDGHDLEALLEQAGENYDLFSITPIYGMVSMRVSMPTTVTGFTVSLKIKN